MVTMRTPLKRRTRLRITEAAIEAWKAADYRGLHRALGLQAMSRSPLPREITALGTSEDEKDRLDMNRCWDQSWQISIELQRELLAIAGWPNCRSKYEENLKDAEEYAAWCKGQVADPKSGGQRFSDPAQELQQRKEHLADALEDAAWRKQLLDELPAEVN